jgi:hypothetical protein
MRVAAGFVALMVAIFLAFPFQEMIPAVGGFHGARVLLVPALFVYGALAFPLPATLVLAAYAGFLSDLAYLHVVDGRVEIALGWSIVFFVIVGLVGNGFRPMFMRGHWYVHLPLAVITTSAYLALQFGMLSLRRGGFILDETVIWRIVGSGLIAGFTTPLLQFVAWQAGLFGKSKVRALT